MKQSASNLQSHNSGNLFARLDTIEYRKPGELHSYENNPRKRSQADMVKLAASIRTFGFVHPVLIDDADCIVAGEKRWLSAKELGLPEIPALRVSHLTPGQVQAFRIADNKLSEAGWDDEKLAREFQSIIKLGEVEIDITGFETAEIDLCIEALDDAGEADDADAIPDPDAGPPVSRTGDLWLLGKHRLLCGNSRDASCWAVLMDGNAAAMVFTDPPYNVRVNGHVSGTARHKEFAEASGEMSRPEFASFLEAAIGAATAHLKDGGIADLCMDFRHMPELYEAADRCGLSVLNLCVWDKGNGAMGSLYRSQHELVLIVKKGKAPHINNVQLGKFGRYRTNVWAYAGANSFGRTRKADLADHPTVKPTALVADAIRDVTRVGDIVVDGFMGSGTTILAAERSGRVAHGLEIDGTYVDVAIRRWEKMSGAQATLAETDETFEQVRARRISELPEEMAPTIATPTFRQRQRPLAA